MTSVSKNVYIDKLDHVVNRYKIKPVDVKSNTYINSVKKMIKSPKFKVGSHAWISSYKNISQKVTLKYIWRCFCD